MRGVTSPCLSPHTYQHTDSSDAQGRDLQYRSPHHGHCLGSLVPAPLRLRAHMKGHQPGCWNERKISSVLRHTNPGTGVTRAESTAASNTCSTCPPWSAGGSLQRTDCHLGWRNDSATKQQHASTNSLSVPSRQCKIPGCDAVLRRRRMDAGAAAPYCACIQQPPRNKNGVCAGRQGACRSLQRGGAQCLRAGVIE